MGRVRRAILTADEAMLHVSRLVALNAEGQAVTVRPATGLASGLVVLDDLDGVGLRRLRDEGPAPLVVTGTPGTPGAPGGRGTTAGRYQAWLRLSTEDLDPQVAAQAERALQVRYGHEDGPGQGGEAAHVAHVAHVGPLAGFIDHTGPRRGRGGNGATALSPETDVSVMHVTVQGAADEPGRMTPTPAARQALAAAEERVDAQRASETQEQARGGAAGAGIARWGGRLAEAVAAELGRDDEAAGSADPHGHGRRHRRAGTGREDDERDGRGDR